MALNFIKFHKPGDCWTATDANGGETWISPLGLSPVSQELMHGRTALRLNEVTEKLPLSHCELVFPTVVVSMFLRW